MYLLGINEGVGGSKGWGGDFFEYSRKRMFITLPRIKEFQCSFPWYVGNEGNTHVMCVIEGMRIYTTNKARNKLVNIPG